MTTPITTAIAMAKQTRETHTDDAGKYHPIVQMVIASFAFSFIQETDGA